MVHFSMYKVQRVRKYNNIYISYCFRRTFKSYHTIIFIKSNGQINFTEKEICNDFSLTFLRISNLLQILAFVLFEHRLFFLWRLL